MSTVSFLSHSTVSKPVLVLLMSDMDSVGPRKVPVRITQYVPLSRRQNQLGADTR